MKLIKFVANNLRGVLIGLACLSVPFLAVSSSIQPQASTHGTELATSSVAPLQSHFKTGMVSKADVLCKHVKENLQLLKDDGISEEKVQDTWKDLSGKSECVFFHGNVKLVEFKGIGKDKDGVITEVWTATPEHATTPIVGASIFYQDNAGDPA